VDFEEAKQEYLRLKAAFEAGEISAAQFEEAVYDLTLIDVDGYLWQIGLSSGAWYRKEGDVWIEATPTSAPAARGASAPEEIKPVKPVTQVFLNLPMWAWTLFALGSMVTLLGIFTIVTFYYINQRPTPVAVARTLVVYGTHTPTLRVTPSVTVERLTPTAALEETATPTADNFEEVVPALTETPTFAPSPQPGPDSNLPAAITWKLISRADFDRLENVRGEWRGILDSYLEDDIVRYQFVNYKGLNGLQLRYLEEFLDVFMETEEEDLILRDIEIDEVIAIQSGNVSGYADIMCRFEDWSFTYAFSINANDWSLLKYNDDQEVQLATGQLPSSFRSGEWGRVRMRCVGETISVWLNSKLLASVRDATFPTGQWAISLYRNEDFEESEIYLYSHRVYMQRDEAALSGDMVQSGNTFITLDRGWRREGSRYSLGLWIENRASETLDFTAAQFYLLRPDGKRIPAQVNPPEGDAFKFPFSVSETLRASNLYFSELTAEDIDWGLQLVIDMTSSGLSEVRFQLPVE
jgi:hypothetical protein